MASRGGKSSHRTISLRIVSPSAKIPTGLSAEGKDCDGTGRYYYVANPRTGRGGLAHVVGTEVRMWKSRAVGRSRKIKNAPYNAPATDTMGEKAASAYLKSIQQSIKVDRSPTTPLKGTWRGYIECHPKGPQVVLYRDVTSYGRIVIVSNLAKGAKDPRSASWETVAVLRNRKWYTTGKVGSLKFHKAGISNLADATTSRSAMGSTAITPR